MPYNTVKNLLQLDTALDYLSMCSAVYFDFETTGLDPHSDTIIILALHGTHPHYDSQTFVIDMLRLPDTKMRKIKVLMENPDILKVAHNAVFDWKFLYHQGVYTAPVYCTMIAEQVLKSGLQLSGFGLDDLASRRLNMYMDKSVRNGFINRDLSIPLTDVEYEYAGTDSWVLEAIYAQQIEEAEKQALTEVIALECEVIPVTSKMEYGGICIDDEKLREALPVVQGIITRASNQLQDEIIGAGAASEIIFDRDGYGAVNPGSSPQMLKVFGEMGIKLRSMGKKELSDWDAQWARKNGEKHDGHNTTSVDSDGDSDMHIGYSHPVLRQHAIRTAAAKLEGTYISGLLDRINPVTGRIHPGFKQCGAVSTGRFSSAGPNFQNIPNKDKLSNLGLTEYDIRSMFLPSPGRRFIISDYSGIELSILAAMSQDKELIHQIIDGDIHSFVATQLIGDKITAALGESLNKKNRKVGAHKVVRDLFKKVSYGIIYGSTGYNLYRTLYFDLLSVGISINQDECDVWVERWKNDLFPGTGVVLSNNSKLAVTRYYTESALGRKRYWTEDVRYDKWKMFAAMREGSNQPIQGTCADMIKRSMVWFDQRVDQSQGRLVACVHDELLGEADLTYVDECAILLGNTMEDAARSFYPDMDPRLFVAEPKVSDCYDK